MCQMPGMSAWPATSFPTGGAVAKIPVSPYVIPPGLLFFRLSLSPEVRFLECLLLASLLYLVLWVLWIGGNEVPIGSLLEPFAVPHSSVFGWPQ